MGKFFAGGQATRAELYGVAIAIILIVSGGVTGAIALNMNSRTPVVHEQIPQPTKEATKAPNESQKPKGTETPNSQSTNPGNNEVSQQPSNQQKIDTAPNNQQPPAQQPAVQAPRVVSPEEKAQTQAIRDLLTSQIATLTRNLNSAQAKLDQDQAAVAACLQLQNPYDDNFCKWLLTLVAQRNSIPAQESAIADLQSQIETKSAQLAALPVY